MFERFTQDARDVVVRAQREARSLGHRWVGTEHLLLGVLADEASGAAQALATLGLDAPRCRDALRQEVGVGVDDDQALRDLGIDIEEVRRRVEQRFGPGALDDALDDAAPGEIGAPCRSGPWWQPRRLRRPRQQGRHLPLTPRAKKALELALRESIRLKAGDIAPDHLVLGIMRTDGVAERLVMRLGVTPDDVRRAVLDRRRAA